MTYEAVSSRNLGLYSTAARWYTGRYYLQSLSTCHVLVNCRDTNVRKWQLELGHFIWFCWLWGTAICPRPPESLSKCQLLLHCALRICIVKLQLAMARNSVYFFPIFFLFVRVFFSLFFMDRSVLVMVQMSHFLSFTDSDKRNKQQQMYP